jgi:hypothetical protein
MLRSMPIPNLPLLSKALAGIGGIVFFVPGLALLLGHWIYPAIPEKVSFLGELVVSLIGLAIAVLAAIPAAFAR